MSLPSGAEPAGAPVPQPEAVLPDWAGAADPIESALLGSVTKPGGESPPVQASVDAKAGKFIEYFGISEEELREQGIDPRKYARAHIRSVARRRTESHAKDRFLDRAFLSLIAILLSGLGMFAAARSLGHGSQMLRDVIVTVWLVFVVAVFAWLFHTSRALMKKELDRLLGQRRRPNNTD